MKLLKNGARLVEPNDYIEELGECTTEYWLRTSSLYKLGGSADISALSSVEVTEICDYLEVDDLKIEELYED